MFNDEFYYYISILVACMRIQNRVEVGGWWRNRVYVLEIMCFMFISPKLIMNGIFMYFLFKFLIEFSFDFLFSWNSELSKRSIECFRIRMMWVRQFCFLICIFKCSLCLLIIIYLYHLMECQNYSICFQVLIKIFHFRFHCPFYLNYLLMSGCCCVADHRLQIVKLMFFLPFNFKWF